MVQFIIINSWCICRTSHFRFIVFSFFFEICLSLSVAHFVLRIFFVHEKIELCLCFVIIIHNSTIQRMGRSDTKCSRKWNRKSFVVIVVGTLRVLKLNRIDAGVVFMASPHKKKTRQNDKQNTQSPARFGSVHSLFSHFYFNLLFIYFCLCLRFFPFHFVRLFVSICRWFFKRIQLRAISQLDRLSSFIDAYHLLCPFLCLFIVNFIITMDDVIVGHLRRMNIMSC